MNIVLLAICIALFFVGWILARHSDGTMFLCAVISFIGVVVILFISAGQIINLKIGEEIIDKKIAILEERNTNIENELGVMAMSYIAHEEETYEKLAPTAQENPIAFINVVPELSSNELIKEQIEVYTENRKQIIELMTSKAELKSLPWYLYFGTVE